MVERSIQRHVSDIQAALPTRQGASQLSCSHSDPDSPVQGKECQGGHPARPAVNCPSVPCRANGCPESETLLFPYLHSHPWGRPQQALITRPPPQMKPSSPVRPTKWQLVGVILGDSARRRLWEEAGEKKDSHNPLALVSGPPSRGSSSCLEAPHTSPFWVPEISFCSPSRPEVSAVPQSHRSQETALYFLDAVTFV